MAAGRTYTGNLNLGIAPIQAPAGSLDVGTDGSTLVFKADDNVLRIVVSEDQVQGLTNKTLDASYNTIFNLTNTALSASAGIVYTKLDLQGSVKNADIGAGAGIAGTKVVPDFGSQDVSTSGRFLVKNSGFHVGFAAPTLSASIVFTLPSIYGTLGQVLTTDGAGSLSWATVLTNAIAENNIFVGNSSNILAYLDTAAVGDALVDSVTGVTIKDEVISDTHISPTADIAVSKLDIDGTSVAGSALYFDGTSYRKDGRDVQTVTVRTSGLADFNSIQSAIDSITDASQSKQYVVDILGTFTENITVKAFVHISSGLGLSASGGPATIFGRISGTSLATTIHGITCVASPVAVDEAAITLEGSVVLQNCVFIIVPLDNVAGKGLLISVASGKTAIVNTCLVAFSDATVGRTAGLIGAEFVGAGAAVWTGASVRMEGMNAASGDYVLIKFCNTGDVATNSPLLTFKNTASGFSGNVTAIYDCGSLAKVRSQQAPQLRLETAVPNTATALAVHNESPATLRISSPVYNVIGFDAAYSQDTTSTGATITSNVTSNRNLPVLTHNKADFITPYMDAKSGFVSWTGTGNYYSVSGSTFNLLRGGVGIIRSNEAIWLGGQSVTLTANATNYVYVDSDGIIGVTTIPSNDFYLDGVPLFEALYDGSATLVVKENHPYEVDTAVSKYLHQVDGSLLSGTGGNLAASANLGKINVVGDAVLLDHGLSTDLTSSNDVLMNIFYKNAADKWIRSYQGDALINKYNLSGVPTISTLSNAHFVFRLYATKNDLNTADVNYIAVMHTALYTSRNSALVAINSGLIEIADSELAALEVVQLGFVVVKYAGAGAPNEIDTIVIARQTSGAVITGDAVSNNASNIVMDTTGFDKILDDTNTTAQSVADALDELTHNELNTLQGGNATERYHLTADMHTQITTGIYSGDTTFQGTVVMQGDFITSHTEEVLVGDNLLVINSGELGAGVTATVAGIEVDRGSATNYQFLFDESTDSFKIGEVGSLQKVATREDTPVDDGYAFWEDSTSRIVTSKVLKPYVFDFNATTAWVDLGDEWEVTVPAATHGRGANAIGTVVTTSGVEVTSDVTYYASGEMYIKVSKDPDYRFAGKIIIH